MVFKTNHFCDASCSPHLSKKWEALKLSKDPRTITYAFKTALLLLFGDWIVNITVPILQLIKQRL